MGAEIIKARGCMNPKIEAPARGLVLVTFEETLAKEAQRVKLELDRRASRREDLKVYLLWARFGAAVVLTIVVFCLAVLLSPWYLTSLVPLVVAFHNKS
jgi:hypothetical protein